MLGEKRRLLAAWLEKAAGKVKRHIPWAPRGDMDASIDGLKAMQIRVAHQTLLDDFGLSLGLFAPEVVVLDLYPWSYACSLDALREVHRILAAVNAENLPNEAAAEFKDWLLNMRSTWIEPYFEFMFFNPYALQDSIELPPSPGGGDGWPLPSGTDAKGAPVLVMLGLFPELYAVKEKHVGFRASLPRPLKPFTRYDDSMFIFTFVEEMLLACGQGLASVLAPIELSHVPEAVGMRKRWVGGFDRVYVDAGKRTPLYQLLKLPSDRKPKVGRGKGGTVLYKSENAYRLAFPNAVNKFSFVSPAPSREYLSWALVATIPESAPVNGLMEKQGGKRIAFDGETLMRQVGESYGYPDSDSDRHYRIATGRNLPEPHGDFTSKEADKGIGQETLCDSRNIKPYAFKPFDSRYCYYSPGVPGWNDPRHDLANQCRHGNTFVITRPATAVGSEGIPFFYTDCLTDGDLLRGHAYCIPACRYVDESHGRPRPNLSPAVIEYLRSLNLLEAYSPEQQARLIWHHVLAVGFSPAYLAANAAALQQDWPRIPFPIPRGGDDRDGENARSLLLQSAALGGEIAMLLKREHDIPPPSLAKQASRYAEIAPLHSRDVSRRTTEPFVCDAIALDAKWGYAIARRKDADREALRNVMPGSGRLFRRNYSAGERRAAEDLGLGMGLHAGAVYAALGHDTCDIYLDRNVYWRNVPSNVWEYRIGGYQVLKKWLSYRERAILGRALCREELLYFIGIVHRLTALRLLESALDRNFARIRDYSGDPTK